jgi:hypothetical protein
MIGMPDYFSKDINSVYEGATKITMRAMGCGNLQCLQEMPVKQLILRLLNAKSPLVQLNLMKDSENFRLPFAYDEMVIPNMHETACLARMSNKDVSVVAGQSKDELDNLKFQFPLRAIVRRLVQDSVEAMPISDPKTLQCVQRSFLNVQGVQETVEDAMFNLGGYHISARSPHLETNSRWHFLITAPASLTKRAWHTAAELLTWSPDPLEDTSQYHHLTKKFVLGKAEPMLLRYAHENFVNFLQNGTPQDKGWEPTQPARSDEVGGLPSKVWRQDPMNVQLHKEHHHSNLTINGLHRLICGLDFNSVVPRTNSMEICRRDVSAIDDLMETFQQELSTHKKSDLLFGLEMQKAFGPKALMKEILSSD